MTLIIDTDTHITEPRDVWTSRMSARKWGDLVPHVVRTEAGADAWFVGDKMVFPAGTSIFYNGPDGQAVMRREAFPELPRTFEDMHPSAYDATARLAAMDDYGIYAAVLYPNLGLTVSDIYLAAGDATPAFRLEAMQAYNDFLVEWASVGNGRLIPLGCIPFWDVEASAAEVERCASIGHRGLVMTGVPQAYGMPLLGDRQWDPMWAAAEAAGLSISFHVGGGDVSRHYNAERKAVIGELMSVVYSGAAFFLENAIQCMDLVTSGVLARFPELKFVIVESGIGWIPFALEAVDDFFKRYRVDREHPEIEGLPSDYFRRQVYANYWFEHLEPWHLERIGVGNILFETDYPHTTCLGRDEMRQAIDRGLADVSDEVRERILWKNAAELYQVDVEPVRDMAAVG